jgi:hypothetical protein
MIGKVIDVYGEWAVIMSVDTDRFSGRLTAVCRWEDDNRNNLFEVWL